MHGGIKIGGNIVGNLFTRFGGMALFCLSAASAQAGSLYVFGDSLVDNGNIRRVYGVPLSVIEGSNAQYYDHGRFSNGPVWVEYLPGLTGLNFTAGNDVAVGGAFAGNLDFGGTSYGDIINVAHLTPVQFPSFDQQVENFAATGGRFGRGDVVAVSASGNNYFLLGTTGNIAADHAEISNAVGQAVSQTAAGLDGLISLGARTLVIGTLGNFGTIPAFSGDTPAQLAFANQIGAANDAALVPAIAQLHAQTGANILVLNQTQITADILADPDAYGKTNVTQACVSVPACLTASPAVQNQYLFWDDEHPTTGTHLLTAEFAAADLNGLRDLAIPAQLAAAGGSDFSNMLDSRLTDLRAGASGFRVDLPTQRMAGQIGGGHGLSGFIAGVYDNGNTNRNDATNGFSHDTGTVILGLDDRLTPALAAGIAFGYGTDHAQIEQGASAALNAYQLGLYATYSVGQFYVNANAGIGVEDYHAKRPGVLTEINARPSGQSYSLQLDGGYMAQFGQVSAGPVAGVNLARIDIGPYTETGDPAIDMAVSGQRYGRELADFGAAAQSAVVIGGVAIQPQARLTVDDLFSGNGGAFSSVFTDEPLVPLTTAYVSTTRYWGDLGFGLSAHVADRLSVTASFETTFAKSDGEQRAFSAGLKYLF
jgi:outer membrane lipase/esterase